METKPLIQIENLSKKFCKSVALSMHYTMADVTKRFLGARTEKKSLRPQEFWALKNLHFDLYPGEAIALIGPNGSGKTTLLKLLQGIYEPDNGRITVSGKVTALMALGTCFHPDYTGRENIWINASALRVPHKEIKNKIDEIIEFSELGEDIDSPVKHYSHGMYLRLGFSVAVHCDSEIFLIDEALSVGDLSFMSKCKQKIEGLLALGRGLICVTHNLQLAKTLCQKAMWFEKGRLKGAGNILEICEAYEQQQKSSNLQSLK